MEKKETHTHWHKTNEWIGKSLKRRKKPQKTQNPSFTQRLSRSDSVPLPVRSRPNRSPSSNRKETIDFLFVLEHSPLQIERNGSHDDPPSNTQRNTQGACLSIGTRRPSSHRLLRVLFHDCHVRVSPPAPAPAPLSSPPPHTHTIRLQALMILFSLIALNASLFRLLDSLTHTVLYRSFLSIFRVPHNCNRTSWWPC